MNLKFSNLVIHHQPKTEKKLKLILELNLELIRFLLWNIRTVLKTFRKVSWILAVLEFQIIKLNEILIALVRFYLFI